MGRNKDGEVMRETENLKLKMPEKNEYINIADINENTEKIDNELAKKADASGGDISETVITSTETSQAEYPVPAAGDSAKTVLGKVQKFFGDLRNWMTGVCLLGQIVNNCVTDNAKLPLSAAQGKVLMDLYNVLNTKGQGYTKTPTLNQDYITSGSSIYCVKSGICIVRFDIYIKQITVDHTILISSLPKPILPTLMCFKPWKDTTGNYITLETTVDGKIYTDTTPGGYLAGYITYPVNDL